MKITLNQEQAKAFKKLETAYNACKKAGILFVNVYGSLEAYDKALVDEYGDDLSLNEGEEYVFPAEELRSAYSFETPVSFADDRHMIRLTTKGMKALSKDEE